MFAIPNFNMMNNKVQYYFSLAMVGCLFFIFGLLSWVNSILIPYFKVACDLQSGVQTYLVTFAFYIAYLVMTIPASFLLANSSEKSLAQFFHILDSVAMVRDAPPQPKISTLP